jgi:hypothetical protein
MTPSLDDRAVSVSTWLADRFREHPVWIAAELELLGKARGIAIGIWWHHPLIRNLGIRSVTIDVTPGNPAICWTVLPEDPEPEGSNA